MAGLRTNALVAAGAAMFVMLSALAARSDDSFRSQSLPQMHTDKVEVRAVLSSTGRQNSVLEQIVSRLSLEPGVSGVSREILAEHE